MKACYILFNEYDLGLEKKISSICLLVGKHSSRVHICATKFRQLVQPVHVTTLPILFKSIFYGGQYTGKKHHGTWQDPHLGITTEH